MSSSQPSSTQGSEITSSLTSPDVEISNDTFHSYRDLSGPAILSEIHTLQSEGIHYAANENIISKCEFVFNKDVKGEMLVPKDTNNKISEFILAGVFQIDARNFFMTSDGKWNQNNPLGVRFEQVKPTCHLLPIQRDPDFSFSTEDFPTIVANLHAIENMANPRKSLARDTSTHSVVIGESNQSTAIKLTHHLFMVHHFHSTKTSHSYIFFQSLLKRKKI